MIYCEQVEGRESGGSIAYQIHYKTPLREGVERFGGYKARVEATNFAIEILKELLDNPAQ